MKHLPLKDARLAAGLTQAELARAVNTTTMQIWRFEKNHRPVTLEWAKVLAPPLKLADPAVLVSDMAEFPAWGLGRPIGRADPQSLPDGDDLHGYGQQAFVERMVLLHWRSLPPADKEAMLTQIMERARGVVRQHSARPSRTNELAVNV